MRYFHMLIAVVSIIVCPGIAAANELPPPLTVVSDPSAAEWQSDIETLRKSLLANHPNPFFKQDASKFESELAAIIESLDSLNSAEVVVRLMGAVALLNDGHTSISPIVQKARMQAVFPIRLQDFSGDLHLVATTEANAGLLGGRLIEVNGVPIGTIRRRIEAISSGDNSQSRSSRVAQALIYPEILQGLGIVSTGMDRAEFTFAIGNDIRRVTMSGEPRPTASGHGLFLPIPSQGWSKIHPAPMSSKIGDGPYSFTYEPESGVFFIRYDAAVSISSDPIPDFSARIRAAIDQDKPAKVVLDLRHNSGGNGYWNVPLLRSLMSSDWLEKEAKLFVLIGPDTFSAGMAAAVEVERWMDPVFVGASTGGSVNNYGDHKPVSLPNSGLIVLISTIYHQNGWAWDEREAIEPDIHANQSFADWLHGIDPALDVVKNFDLSLME